MVDNSPSQFLSDAGFVSHIFRMSLFFFIAGFFGRLLYHKLGARGFWANRGKRIVVPLIVGWVILVPIIFYVWNVGMTKVFGGTPPAPPADAARLVPAHAPVVPVRVAAVVRRGHCAARHRGAIRRRAETAQAASTRWS